MKIQVKVLKFAGETGLRKVGSEYSLEQSQAKILQSKGFVEIIDEPIKKEEKSVHETKELKIKLETKYRKPVRKTRK